MKKTFLSALIFCLMFTLISCASTLSNTKATFEEELLITDKDFPKYLFNKNVIGEELTSPVEGVITSVQEGKYGTEIIINCTQDYFWKGELCHFDYDFIFVGIENYIPNEGILINEPIGTITKNTAFTARASNLNPFLVRMSSGYGVSVNDYFYFRPTWIYEERTQFLNYRQIDSIDAHANDFYERWTSEIEPTDTNYVVTIFNYPELDSVRAKIVLNEYPEPIENTYAGFVSNAYFGYNLFVSQTELESTCEYTPYLFWQEGFVEYLQNEYTLGTDLYVYCSFLGFDNENKKIVINVRDFAVKSDEEIVEERINNIVYR